LSGLLSIFTITSVYRDSKHISSHIFSDANQAVAAVRQQISRAPMFPSY
jgi:hypothetical protein